MFFLIAILIAVLPLLLETEGIENLDDPFKRSDHQTDILHISDASYLLAVLREFLLSFRGFFFCLVLFLTDITNGLAFILIMSNLCRVEMLLL